MKTPQGTFMMAYILYLCSMLQQTCMMRKNICVRVTMSCVKHTLQTDVCPLMYNATFIFNLTRPKLSEIKKCCIIQRLLNP